MTAKIIGLVAVTNLWVVLSGAPVAATDSSQPPNALLSTHFTTDDGLIGSVVDQIAQTQDGFLWLITRGANLVRFDGKKFYRFQIPRMGTLACGPDGDLWIGSSGELIRIPSSNLNQFELTGFTSYHPGPDKASQITCLRFGKSGALWVGTNDGLFRLEGDQFVAVGPRSPTGQIEEAPDGHLLVTGQEGFIEIAGSDVLRHPGLADQLGVKDNEIYHVLKDRRGNTWYCTALGVARETDGRIEKLGTYAPLGHGGRRTFEDAQGTVWIGKADGLFRATSTGIELVAGDMQVWSLYGDHDGDVWVGTNGDGLYRFRDRAVKMFTKEDGLPNDVVQTVLAGHDGTVWVGSNCGGISRFDGTHFQTLNEKDGLANSCVWALAEDANHDLWIGTWGGGAFRYHNRVFTQYAKSQGMADDRVTSIVAARDGAVWFGTRDGLTRLKNGQLRTFTTVDGLSNNLIWGLFEDRAGVIWVGTKQGLDRLVGDRFENLASAPRSFPNPFGEDPDGGLLVNDDGAATLRFKNDHIDTIRELAVDDMVETEQGDLLFGGLSICRVPAGSLAQSRKQDEPLDYEAFSTADGLATARVGMPGRVMALTANSALWIATGKGLARLDLRRLPITNAKPSIYLTDVMIGRNTHQANHEVVLPPGTSHTEIYFAAVEISSPEKIRMQYRLDGVDSEWLDAGPSPRAVYNTVPVGTHALHIRACNRNGIWDRQGVVFAVTQQPFFYQTRWFIAAMLALGVLFVFMTYRLRVRQISRSINARFDERLAERTRVAREIHDTFLQTVQGSKLVADHALKDPADNGRMVRAMEQLSAWLEQATEEGRAALNSLRASTTERNDLADAFHRAIDECRIQTQADISFSVTGDSREMHPVVRDEIYRIGYEAIRNSCAHSGGDRLNITLEYAHDLTLHISDNGVGIDPEVAQTGKDGHFGLPGMRERAERIGGKFTLASSPDSGTAITLVVPGRVIFHSDRPHWTERVKSLFRRN
ncbi:MAG TPA: two-component regulator propeller domain-containing protein [Blastocatellia bacterium]|nr:two-component regulator propeller domain-containing protein [Blastocatellia bacterium]